jgi:hypothetical protein
MIQPRPRPKGESTSGSIVIVKHWFWINDRRSRELRHNPRHSSANEIALYADEVEGPVRSPASDKSGNAADEHR